MKVNVIPWLFLLLLCSAKAYLSSRQSLPGSVCTIVGSIAHRRPLIVLPQLFQQPQNDVSSNSNNLVSIKKKGVSSPPLKPGPLGTIKRMVILAVLAVKISYMRLLLAISNTFRSIIGNKDNIKMIQRISSLLRQRKFWIRMVIASTSFVLMKRYLAFTKSLTTEVSYAAFLKLMSTSPERIVALKITPSAFFYRLDGTKCALTRAVSLDPWIMGKLAASGIDFAAPPTPANVLGLLVTFGYMAFLWNISTRMMQGPQDDGAGKRKDRAGSNDDALGNLSFADVAGQERAKLEVMEVCDMLRDPTRYTNVGARLPAGVLLVGPPGTGKTLLARVTAAEAGVPFYACSASDFVEVFVGRGPARVRKLFKQAAENAPCIVFIDEIDSVGRSRRMGSMNSEQENTLNQILTSMDGLDTSNNGVVVMSATNRFELLDPALLRAGRFDRIVQCPLPDREGRLAILSVHVKKFKLAPEVDLDRIAKLTPGTCGADLSAICNEAAIRTVRRAGSLVSPEDFDEALRSFFAGRGFPVAGMYSYNSYNTSTLLLTL